MTTTTTIFQHFLALVNAPENSTKVHVTQNYIQHILGVVEITVDDGIKKEVSEDIIPIDILELLKSDGDVWLYDDDDI